MCGSGTRVVEHQSVDSENRSKRRCGTPVSWFLANLGVPSDGVKGVHHRKFVKDGIIIAK